MPLNTTIKVYFKSVTALDRTTVMREAEPILTEDSQILETDLTIVAKFLFLAPSIQF